MFFFVCFDPLFYTVSSNCVCTRSRDRLFHVRACVRVYPRLFCDERRITDDNKRHKVIRNNKNANEDDADYDERVQYSLSVTRLVLVVTGNSFDGGRRRHDSC